MARHSLTHPGHRSCSEPFSSQLWIWVWRGTHLLQTHLISDHNFHPVHSDKKGTSRHKRAQTQKRLSLPLPNVLDL